jgi:DNA helicase-2/ATP-dependent DNA helicase PcrA
LYEKELQNRNAVDFDNILLLTRNLLRDYAEIRQKYQEFFQFILVDEYQDSNNLQEELTNLLLTGPNLFCVGDDWQAIYGFRGCNVKHFLAFKKKYKEAKIFRLENNYRSTNEIVRIANNLIEYNKDRMGKRCFSEREGGVVELHGFSDEYEEAEWVSKKIKTLRDMDILYDKVAVLYRTKFSSLAFEKAFRYSGIPYQMKGSKGFFERKEILDLNSYLVVSVFPKDDISFKRILNIPRRGIGPATIKKFERMCGPDTGLQDAVRNAVHEKKLAPKLHVKLKELISMIDEISALEPKEAIEKVISRSGYYDYLKGYAKTDEDYTSRLENIEELIYTASQKRTLTDYLEEASLLREDRENSHEDGSGVNLSTIHASKGLEYSAVFIVGCVEDLFPHWRSKALDLELQEERRLMYVAITRASHYLYISYSKSRKGLAAARSRFLIEIENSSTALVNYHPKRPITFWR